MLKFSLVFIGFIVCLTLMFRGAILLMSKIISRRIEECYQLAGLIAKTRKPPKSWTYKLEKKITLLERTPNRAKKMLEMEERAKAVCLKRISKLINYFETTSLVKDEKTAEILLSNLQEIHRLWQERDWKEIMTF